jgi:glutathione S-transferase
MGTLEGFQPSFESDGVNDGRPVGGERDRSARESAAKEPAPGAFKLYGSPTSPYTRKIRILARAAGVDVTFIDTRTEEGASALAHLAPLGKIPVAEIADVPAPRVLPDSGLIAAWLWARHASALRAAGFAAAPEDPWAERELTIVVEGALDAAINRFYLLRDKLPDQGYVKRQNDRVATALAWLEAYGPAFERPVSAPALSLGCALDWMAFRAVVDLARTPRLLAFRAAWTASGVGAGTEPV